MRTIPLKGIDFTTMPQDEKTEFNVARNIHHLQLLNISTQKRECHQVAMSPSYVHEETKFAHDPVSMKASESIYQTLLSSGFVNEHTGLIIEDPFRFNWRSVLLNAKIPGVTKYLLTTNNSTIEEALTFAWAHHEFCSTDIDKTLEYFANLTAEKKTISSLPLVSNKSQFDLSRFTPRNSSCSLSTLNIGSSSCKVPCESFENIIVLNANYSSNISSWKVGSYGGLENRMKVCFRHQIT
jgi:hypothetical protein